MFSPFQSTVITFSLQRSVGTLAYLLLYNLASAAGWSWVLVLCLNCIISGRLILYYCIFYSYSEPTLMSRIDVLWEEVENPLKVVQTMACLEVLHAFFGLVKSPWTITFLQGLYL